MASLYRRILGDRFDQMPTALRGFHDIERETVFRSTFKITRGKGWMKSLLCKIGGLPKSGEEVPVRLKVIPEGERERWIRQFGDHKLESVQWTEGGLMLEHLGPVRMAFRLIVEGPKLRLQQEKVWLFNRLRWPLALAPSGSGEEFGTEEGVEIIARAHAPLLGKLVEYRGLVVPDD